MAVPCVKLNSGHLMPMLGLGTWKAEPPKDEKKETQMVIEYAIDCGYRLFDTAHIYENEEGIGMGIHSKIANGVVKREDVFITDKLWNTHHKPEDVRPALLQTLKKLNMKYVDLYLIHFPMGFEKSAEFFPKDENGDCRFDDTDYVDTWKEMEKLQEEGLARSIGVSNFNPYQISRIIKECKIPPVVNEIEHNPYWMQEKNVQFCQQQGIVIIAYGSLGSRARGWGVQTDPVLMEDPKLCQIAKKLNKSVAQVVLKFQIQKGIAVIPNSSTPSRIKSNIQVFDFTLNDEEMKTIGSLDTKFTAFTFKVGKKHKYYPYRDDYTE